MLFATLLGVATSSAQSISIDEQKAEVVPPEPVKSTPSKPPIAERVVPPKPLDAAVAYPEGQVGAETVVLELTISKAGMVTEARAVTGRDGFSAQAVDAARNWHFSPALQNGVPVAAKIRFAVEFVPPVAEEQPPATQVVQTPKPAARDASAKKKRDIEVTVRGEREPLRQTMTSAEIRELPGAFGDPYRAIEAMPGVVPAVSGLPYFYVRGAPPGNVGYFFDGVPVPYLYHFAAGPGVLNPAFVDHVDFYPGAYPARYGRYSGAIVAGEMAAPQNRFRGEGSVRLVDSGGMVETPFARGRGSVMLGGRYSYTGPIVSLVVPKITMNYWDYQMRTRYALGVHGDVEVLAFGAADFVSEKKTDIVYVPTDPNDVNGVFQPVAHPRVDTLVDVAFHRFDTRWTHKIARGQVRTALLIGYDRTGYDNRSVVVSNHLLGARSEARQRLGADVEWRFGTDILLESFAQKVGNKQYDPLNKVDKSSISTPLGSFDQSGATFSPARKDLTAGIWTDVVLDVERNIQLVPGLRVDEYVSGGDSTAAVDPRVSARFTLSKRVTVVHGLALVHQSPSFVLPAPGVKPSLRGGLQRSVQSSAGVSVALPAGFDASATLFHNAFSNMTDYVSLVQLQYTTKQGSTDLRTHGQAYGLELMLKRSLSRRFGGFASYTLSRSERSVLNMQGPATTDRTHVFNIAAAYDLGRNWRAGGRWMIYSGIPTTVAYVEAAQRPPRTPPYWRIDVKLQKRWIIAPPYAWWGVSFELLNATLNHETIRGACNAYRCRYENFGPVTVPAIGVEAAF